MDREQFLKDGYYIVPNVLTPDKLQELKEAAVRLVESQTEEEKDRLLTTGSSIAAMYQDKTFADIIAWKPAIDSLKELGYNDPRWWSAFLLSRPPHSPALYWHQDWWAWGSEIDNTEKPFQLFLMYYLVDTTKDNGCLRVIPGSHVKKHPILSEIHSETDTPTYHNTKYNCDYQEGEIGLCVKAGDLIIGDARILHASHPNNTDAIRTVYTLWYYPDYTNLPDKVRATIGTNTGPETGYPLWWKEGGDQVLPLITKYEGTETPLIPNRVPL